jgi:hypothetical protein
MFNIYNQLSWRYKMKKISLFIFCLSTIIILTGGCAVWKDLNTPIKKRKKTQQRQKDREEEVLPDGSTIGLNSYERKYLNSIDKNFKRREQMNSRKVFGTPGRQ